MWSGAAAAESCSGELWRQRHIEQLRLPGGGALTSQLFTADLPIVYGALSFLAVKDLIECGILAVIEE